MQPVKKRNGASNVHLRMFVPIDGPIARSYQHPLLWHDDYQIHRIVNNKTMERECIDLHEFIERNEGVVVEFHMIHYQALILDSKTTMYSLACYRIIQHI